MNLQLQFQLEQFRSKLNISVGIRPLLQLGPYINCKDCAVGTEYTIIKMTFRSPVFWFNNSTSHGCITLWDSTTFHLHGKRHWVSSCSDILFVHVVSQDILPCWCRFHHVPVRYKYARGEIHSSRQWDFLTENNKLSLSIIKQATGKTIKHYRVQPVRLISQVLKFCNLAHYRFLMILLGCSILCFVINYYGSQEVILLPSQLMIMKQI